MSGPAARSTMTLALVALALALSASSGTAAASRHAPILGIVPHAGLHASSLFGAATTIGSGPAVFHGGGVMHTNTAYAIYWVPSGQSVDANYESLINRYFSDVAAASGSQSNVYAVTTQYYDIAASIQYASAFGGAYVDTNPFPAFDPAVSCEARAGHACLTDQQIQEEIQRVIALKGWHAGASSLFFLMTPDGVDSCIGSGGSECSTNFFCAYHSAFTDTSTNQSVLYANEPYAGTDSGCTYSLVGQQGFPNDHDADATINTISHEHNEAITDPFGTAWWADDPNGDEIADLCAGDFGAAPLGHANGQPYDQLINGHPYSVQQEYSNDNADCATGYTPTVAPLKVAAPVLSGAAGQGQLLTTSNGSWMHAPSGYAYQWQRCAANGSGCADISGTTAASYRLTAADAGHAVRAEVSAHNAVGTSALSASVATLDVVPQPSSTAAPVLSGTAAVGKKLSTTAGTWNTQATFTYAWLRCTAGGTGCAAIPSATSAAYVAVAADRGHTLESSVTATNAAGTAAAVSKLSGDVIAAPHVRKTPHISGRARVKRRLSATRGTWSGPPKRYRFQWLRCNARGGSCVRIRGATHSSYRPAKRDARHRLRVRVTASNAAGRGTATSAASGRVPATQ